MERVRLADIEDVAAVKRIVDSNRNAFGFVLKARLEGLARQHELLVKEHDGQIVGFITFHHRRDGWTTIHELCVSEEFQGNGVGRVLVEEVIQQARSAGQKGVRLKCPIDLPSNGFYARLGFNRVSIEDSRDGRRALAVWEKRIEHVHQRPPVFYLSLTHSASEIRQIMRLWLESGDPRNPFANVIFTPLFTQPAAIKTIRELKEQQGCTVIFDSGGYQVQAGKIAYEQLFGKLLQFYREHAWADWYVLPDRVPHSKDADADVEMKVRDTIDFARLFVRMMGASFAERALGVVHGRTEEQMRRCVLAYAEMGLRYIGFGSFGTSGPNGTVNLVSQKSLKLLKVVRSLANEYGLHLHIFGIGSPSHLVRLGEAGIVPTSFDSAGWWKAGGFGNIFFPGGKQLHITAVSSPETTLSGIAVQKHRSNHDCPFCSDLKLLRRRRIMRVLHNLVAMMDTYDRIWEAQH